MPYINDTALDALIQDIQDNGEELHICSQEPTTYVEATTTYSLGTKDGLSMAEPTDKAGGGRESVISAITDGVVDASGTATHWAIVKASATSRLLATGALDQSQGVILGNVFTLTEFAVGVPDAV